MPPIGHEAYKATMDVVSRTDEMKERDGATVCKVRGARKDLRQVIHGYGYSRLFRRNKRETEASRRKKNIIVLRSCKHQKLQRHILSHPEGMMTENCFEIFVI